MISAGHTRADRLVAAGVATAVVHIGLLVATIIWNPSEPTAARDVYDALWMTGLALVPVIVFFGAAGLIQGARFRRTGRVLVVLPLTEGALLFVALFALGNQLVGS